MSFLSKKFLGNTLIFWILFILLGPIGFYLVFMEHDSKGFYFLILMCGLMILFESVIFKKYKR
ncbi:hypothetical protein [Solibacillus cecembensis]|uniref:hypothetical protein n=1 Tax=Solibacillus cecembensis TaxID=459347 RepID=UPI003D07C3E2